jgi:uncharacterized Zn-binding protein involved in type VI secretion
MSVKRWLNETLETYQEIKHDAQEWIQETAEEAYERGVPERVKDVVESVPDEYDPRRVPVEVDRELDRWIDWIQEQLEDDREEPSADDLDLPTHDDTPEDDDDPWFDFDWADLFRLVAIAWLVYEFWMWLREFELDIFTLEVDYDVEWLNIKTEMPLTRPSIAIDINAFAYFVPQPQAARVFDPLGHGTPAIPGPGSANVLIGGLPALRAIDQIVCMQQSVIPHTPSPIKPTNTSVKVNGAPLLRAGDAVLEGPAGPNPIVRGCSTVHVGSPVPPTVMINPTLRVTTEEIGQLWLELSGSTKLKYKASAGFTLRSAYLGFGTEIEPVNLSLDTGAKIGIFKVRYTADVALPSVSGEVKVHFTSPKPELEVEDAEYKPGRFEQDISVELDLPWE